MVYYSNFKTDTNFDKTFVHLQRFRYVIFGLCMVFGLAFLWQINSTSTRGFKINELEVGIDNLKESSQRLELQAASAQSWTSLQARIKQLNMVESGAIEYLNPVGTGVALR